MRLVCFIVACVSIASAAAVKPPEAALLSVVKVGPNGRLIRVWKPITRAAGVDPTLTVVAAPRLDGGTPAAVNIGSSRSEINSVIAQFVDSAAERYQVDPLLVHSVIHAESNFNPMAVSPKGAQGLMQLIPATAQRFGVTDPFDPQQNIEGGVRYLKYLQSKFPEDLSLAIAAYNAGEGAVARFKNVPPYRETMGYVRKVSQEYSGRKLAHAPAKLESAGLQTGDTEEAVRHIEQIFDSEGRLSLRTR